MKVHLEKKYFDKAKDYYDRCVDCGKCVKCCPIMTDVSRTPKQFLKSLMLPTNDDFIESTSCLNCGYCKSICPKSLDIGELLYELKKVNVKFNRDKKYRHKYRVILSHQKNSFIKLLVNSTANEKVFFPGCSLSANNPAIVIELSKRLKEDGIGLYSGCCASPSNISGDIGTFNKNKSKIEQNFKKYGIKEVFVACSNCYIALKKIEGIKVTSVYELLKTDKYIDTSISNTYKSQIYILHDPCPTRFENEIHHSVRDLLNKVSVKFTEFENSRENTSCCGDGGMVSVLNKEISNYQLQNRTKEANGKNIISYCQSCVNNFKSQNNDSKHILEFLIDVDVETNLATSTLKKWSNRYVVSKYVNKLK
jgi:Fe-S oxidoreductase